MIKPNDLSNNPAVLKLNWIYNLWFIFVSLEKIFYLSALKQKKQKN